MQTPPHAEFMAFAERMADATGAMLAAAAANRPDVEFKSDSSFVTSVDKAIETKLREMIEAEYPSHGILGEEFGSKNVGADLVWVLDPIDGTAQFIAGIPVYGTLIALAWKGRPFLGVINHPATADRWTGVVGAYAKRNGNPVNAAPSSGLDTALVTCSNPDFMSAEDLERFTRLRKAAAYVQYGGSCYAYGLLASGRTNLAIDGGLDPFDFFACAAVVNGAGGVISNWQGDELTVDWSGGILAAANQDLHEAAMALLEG